MSSRVVFFFFFFFFQVLCLSGSLCFSEFLCQKFASGPFIWCVRGFKVMSGDFFGFDLSV